MQGPQLSDGEILWNMLEDSRTFTIKDLDVQQLKKHVDARKNVVTAIGKFGGQFPNSDGEYTFNTSYWSGVMVVKAGMSASDAVNDAFTANGGLYTLGCRYTSFMILLEGIATTDKAAFDSALKANGQSAIFSQAFGAKLLIGKDVQKGGENPTLKNWVPGDKGYIEGYRARGLDAGENIIYMGGGQFWGAPPYQGNLLQMMNHVKGFSNGKASENGQRIFPGSGLDKVE